MVGTPGRLLDVLNRNTYLVLRELEVLVLDEGRWVGHLGVNGGDCDVNMSIDVTVSID